ncbi:MAG: sulfotransferase [Actinomycetota bacterium]
MTSVLYIGGYGRGGSTLLDILLGSHPRVLGGGELEMFFKDVVADGTCSCGRRYADCPVWGEVLAALRAEVDGFDADEVATTLASLESTRGAVVGADFDTRRRYGRVWRQFFDSAARRTGSNVVVDSSKSSRGSSGRVRLLMREAGLDVTVIHLMRDPRAVLYSERRRGNNDRLESDNKARFLLGGAFRPLIGWTMANVAVSVLRRRHPKLRVVRVRYEDLMADPRRELERIGDATGLDLSVVIKRVECGDTFDPGHGVRGNRMRRSGPVRIRFDDQWTRELSWMHRAAAVPFAPVARFYGYDLLRRPQPLPGLGPNR